MLIADSHASNWLSVYYNASNNFLPSNERSDLIGGDLIGNRTGEGRDAGIKLRLFGNRVSANLGWYETNDTNRSVGIDNAWFNHINAIWRTLGKPEQQIDVYRNSQDLSGDGYEFELTANVTPQWRTTLNWSITEQMTDNQNPRTLAEIAKYQAEWQSNAARDLDRTGTTLTAPTRAAPSISSTRTRAAGASAARLVSEAEFSDQRSAFSELVQAVNCKVSMDRFLCASARNISEWMIRSRTEAQRRQSGDKEYLLLAFLCASWRLCA